MKAEFLKLTKQVILKYLTEEQIFEKYFGSSPQLHILYTNDKLRKDSSPGCVFYYRENNKLIFNDFAWGREFDCFDYVIALHYNCTFPKALEIIAKDFGLIDNKIETLAVKRQVLDKKERVYNRLEITRKRKFFEEDLKYWNIADLDITEELLKKYKIFAIKNLWEHSESGTKYYDSKHLKLTFAYHWDEYNYQIYFPLRDKTRERKFINTHGIKYGDIEFIDWNANHIVITKSKKDAFFLRLFGINVFFIIHEAIKLDEKTQNIIKQFDQVFTLFDNDRAGKRNSYYYRKHYNTQPLFFLTGEGKDTYDVLKKYGKYYLIDLIQQVKRDYNL